MHLQVYRWPWTPLFGLPRVRCAGTMASVGGRVVSRRGSARIRFISVRKTLISNSCCKFISYTTNLSFLGIGFGLVYEPTLRKSS